MNRKTVLIIVGGVLVLCVCACLVVSLVAGGSVLAALGLSQPIADAGDKFMQALKAGDYTAAYNLCDPSLKQELKSAQGLKQMIERGQAQPVKWSFDSRNIDNNTGTLEGHVTMKGGEGTLTLELAKTGDNWLITGFDLNAD